MSEQVLTGIPTAPGIAIGEVFLFRHDEPTFREFCVLQDARDKEIARFEEAVEDTRRQIIALHDRLAGQTTNAIAEIFEVQAAFLDDEMYTGEIRRLIIEKGVNAEAAVQKTTDKLHETLAALEVEQFRQRTRDIQDVGQRIIRNLLGAVHGALEPLERSAILVADDLLPSDVIHLLDEHIQAVATDLGGATSHTAILTRSLEVPAVVGLRNLSRLVKKGDRIIVNGNSGKVIIRPSTSTNQSYQVKRASYEAYIAGLKNIEHLPAETLDGRHIALRANLELPQEVRSVVSHGGEGVGLFRSEYLFLARKRLPSEEDQLADYRRVIEAVSPHPVTIRTFDLGGDKVFPDMPHPVEANPFMGWRAVRVSLDQPKLLHIQLRAIMRAGTAGPIKIMFPFVSGVLELKQVKKHIAKVKDQLQSDGIEFNPDIEIGVMIELPSAVMMADRMAHEVDFFSIGTNDLTQFTLAVDRGNEMVSQHYRPLHPAMMRMIRMTVRAGHAAGIEVAMCGELAASPLATMLLIGLGLDELSVSPVAIPEVKKLIRSMKYSEAVVFAEHAMNFDTEPELYDFCRDEMKRRFADLPIWFNDEF